MVYLCSSSNRASKVRPSTNSRSQLICSSTTKAMFMTKCRLRLACRVRWRLPHQALYVTSANVARLARISLPLLRKSKLSHRWWQINRWRWTNTKIKSRINHSARISSQTLLLRLLRMKSLKVCQRNSRCHTRPMMNHSGQLYTSLKARAIILFKPKNLTKTVLT